MMHTPTYRIAVVDDDPRVCRSVSRTLRHAGYEARAFTRAMDWLGTGHLDRYSCVLSDIRMPDMDGLTLQRTLRRSGIRIPTIIMTAAGDVNAVVDAMKLGAADVLLKPFAPDALVDAVRHATRGEPKDATRATENRLRVAAQRLTQREAEVVALVAAGLLNKQIAAQLGVTVRTVKAHRARAMRKLDAHSIVDLVRFVDRLANRAAVPPPEDAPGYTAGTVPRDNGLPVPISLNIRRPPHAGVTMSASASPQRPTPAPLARPEFQTALRLAVAVHHASDAALLLRDDGGALRMTACTGIPPALWPAIERAMSTSDLIAAACARREHLLLRHARRQAEDRVLRDLARALHAHALDVHPLALDNNDILGAIVVLFRWPHRPAPSGEPLADQCCALSATMISAARQLTAAEAARAQAEGLATERLFFMAKMSHELRTPLQSIVGYLDLLRSGVAGPMSASQLDMLDRAKLGEQVVLSVINDLDNLARLESGKVEYFLARVPVSRMARTALAIVRPLARRTGVHVRADALPPGLVAFADERKATQVVINLLTNAVKFSPPGSRVRLDAVAQGDMIVIHVRDTGRGIPRDRLDTIFDPFVQLGERVPKGLDGYGLGLAVSREFAAGMGGSLTASSEPGLGTTFRFTLPAARTPVSRLRPDAPSRDRRPSRLRSARPAPADSG